MDALDQSIITLLRHNARKSISDIAEKLKVSRATVRSRLDQLEAKGEILGYTVILKTDDIEQPVRGITLIEVERHNADHVIKALGGFSEISAVHTTNGRFDLIAELAATTLTELDKVLRRMRLINGITLSETHLILSTPRSTRARLTAKN